MLKLAVFRCLLKANTEVMATTIIAMTTTKSGNGKGSISEPVLMVGIAEVGLGEGEHVLGGGIVVSELMLTR
jgi:hypothetical protein